MPKERKEKPIFSGLTIARAGDYEEGWTDTQVQQWLQMRDGKFSRDMDETVTHLLCSKEEFRKKGPRGMLYSPRSSTPSSLQSSTPPSSPSSTSPVENHTVPSPLSYKKGSSDVQEVKAALKSSGRKCYIVHQDWLFQCIEKKRKVLEKDYLLANIMKEEVKERVAKKQKAKGEWNADRFVNTNLFHLYTDSTFFQYMVVLTHQSDESDESSVEKYTLHIFESNAKPHLYHFVVKFLKKRGDSQPTYYRPSDTSQTFAREFEHFKTFFHKKTDIHWNDRLLKPAPTTVVGKKLFKYEPPTAGKPVGVVEAAPQKFVREEESMDVECHPASPQLRTPSTEDEVPDADALTGSTVSNAIDISDSVSESMNMDG